MIILGLDPSLRQYGWALHDTEGTGPGRCVDRGRFQTKVRDFTDEISRYVYLRKCLEELIEAHPTIEAIGIETPVMNEFYSEGMYGLFLFSLEGIKRQAQDVVFLAPPQVKRFAKDLLERPGGWSMGKMDMCQAAQEDTTIGTWNHNEADAYLVAAMAGRFWQFYVGDLEEDDLTPYEKQTFTLIREITRGKRKGETEIKGILHREGDRFFLWSMG